MNTSGIYQIQSIIKPERCYIGSAVDIHDRWSVHLCLLRKNKHHSKIIQRHYNKYGESDLQFSILLRCKREYLIVNEQIFIDSYKPYFNSRPNANSQLGFNHSEETKKKLKEINTGKKYSEETCKKHSDAIKGENHPMFGKHHTEESKLKNKESHLGKIPWNKGKVNVYSEESKKRMSISQKNKPPMQEETRQKISQSMIGLNTWMKGRTAWNKGKKLKVA